MVFWGGRVGQNLILLSAVDFWWPLSLGRHLIMSIAASINMERIHRRAVFCDILHHLKSKSFIYWIPTFRTKPTGHPGYLGWAQIWKESRFEFYDIGSKSRTTVISPVAAATGEKSIPTMNWRNPTSRPNPPKYPCSTTNNTSLQSFPGRSCKDGLDKQWVKSLLISGLRAIYFFRRHRLISSFKTFFGLDITFILFRALVMPWSNCNLNTTILSLNNPARILEYQR